MFAAVPVRLWDVKTGRELHELSGHVNTITDLAFSPTGKRLATCGGRPGHVIVWDVELGKRVVEQFPDDRQAESVAFSPDGHAMVTAAPDGTVSIWRTGTWQRIAQVQGHRDRVSDLHFTRDGQLLSGGMDTTIIAWKIPALER
jgi:WD40 repeat protein